MLWILYSRPKPWIFTSLSLSYAHSLATRCVGTPARVVGCGGAQPPPRLHSSACHIGSSSGGGGGAASIWHAILPSGYGGCRRPGPTSFLNDQKGEGSWNVAWDARPARWLHHSDSAWFLFGVCACLSAPLDSAAPAPDGNSEAPVSCSNDSTIQVSAENDVVSPSYRVRGVPPDGRCLFRSIAHLTCLRNGEEAPDENRQRELADELRARVVDELLRRRKESEWFIEGDFDAYIRNIQKPSVWGGEPELMMACHVLRTSISIFAIDRISGRLVKIADYGEEYRKDKEKPMTLMYHWYGHYDVLEGDVSHECYANKK